MATVTLPQVSLAAGASKSQALVHSTVLLPTQVIVGLVVSSTVTFWLHSAKLPHSSVARQVRVESKVLPQSPVVLVVVLTTVTVALLQESLAAGASKSQMLVHSTVLSPTQVMVGLVVSTTVTFWLHRSEEHTSELQSPCNLVCRLLLEKKNSCLVGLS